MGAASSPVSALIDEHAERRPEALALVERAPEGSRTLTYAALRAEARAVAGRLAARGVRRGDVVAVWLPNWIESVVLEFALARLGAANLGVNTRYSVFELEHLMRAAQPVGIVMPESFHGLDFETRLDEALTATGITPWVARLRPGEWPLPSGEPDAAGGGSPDVQLNYFTTSGSTGVPKLVGHDQDAVATHARNVAVAFGMAPGDAMLSALPLSGVFGLNPTMGMLAAGGACVLVPVFDAATVVTDMAEHRVTHVVGGDDLLGRIVDAWRADPRPLPAFRAGGIADFAGRAEEVVRWAQDEHAASIVGVYGSSELFALTALWPLELELPDRIRGGGRLVSDAIEVRVAETQTGAICGPGVTGELQFRGYNVLTDYLGNPDAAARAFTADGWFHSGDLGHLDPEGDGFVYLCRAGDALRLRGFLVEPAEIEQFLASHRDVDTAKVVGVAAATGEDVAVAFVTLRPEAEADADTLLAHCRARLARFKVPTALLVIDAFPVTSGTNGTKIKTSELRRWALDDLARETT
jgi:acyl-CoA synthetase (AMP-forming)/AMP-acid ligase II